VCVYFQRHVQLNYTVRAKLRCVYLLDLIGDSEAAVPFKVVGGDRPLKLPRLLVPM
jgi:hypothetical protein